MAHTIQVSDTFSGPLDLLLYLVRREEIDLQDIPIAKLTREYLAEINRRGLVDVEDGGEFVAMATTLVEMKSRWLLPATADAGDEEEAWFDPRQGLAQTLLAYKFFKQAAGELARGADEYAAQFSRPLAPDLPTLPIEPEAHSPWELFAAFQKIAQKIIADRRRRQIVNEEVSTERRIAQIENALAEREVVAFTALLGENPGRDTCVGIFIAILELVRLKKITARQSVDFSEIYLRRRVAPPRPATATPGGHWASIFSELGGGKKVGGGGKIDGAGRVPPINPFSFPAVAGSRPRAAINQRRGFPCGFPPSAV
ncbi:MAG: segregation/condensation protein A [Planctomycetota bacterium]|jgi:segregation and condensation protein A|nr:segregation/condensation protein A [Planctomycetota bacterium]